MRITIIIPNYNGKHFLKPCLDSLSKQSYTDFDIMIIDNHSTDGSIEYIKEHYPKITLITLNQNYGFSTAVNEGIRRASAPYIILLNNDTVAEPRFVEELLKAVRRSPRIFSVSSKMLQMHHPDLIDGAGDLYTLLGWGVARGAGRPSDNYNRPEEVFSACAGAAIYRRSVFRKIGYFDETHFAYLEDIDIGYRAKIYGYQNLYCPTAIVHHVGSGTSGSKYNSFKVRTSARNSIWLIYKNMPFPQLLINSIPLLAGYFIKGLFFHKIGYGKDYLQGLREGLHGLKRCRKVRFRLPNLLSYIKIEIQLIEYTFRYAQDWGKRKILKI